MTDGTAIAYAGLRVALRRLGRPIPANDAWIAALTRHGCCVRSRCLSHRPRILRPR